MRRSSLLRKWPRPVWPRSVWPRSVRGRRRAAMALGAALLLLLWSLHGGRQAWPRDQILAAIRFVESGDRTDVPDGDGGRAIGPYQIHSVYWQDAVQFDPSLGGSYADCRRRDYAEAVVDAYMRRWAPSAWAAGDAEVVARIHNGGPEGHRRGATLGYWQRVRARLP